MVKLCKLPFFSITSDMFPVEPSGLTTLAFDPNVPRSPGGHLRAKAVELREFGGSWIEHGSRGILYIYNYIYILDGSSHFVSGL
jgi:hypothetical protein